MAQEEGAVAVVHVIGSCCDLSGSGSVGWAAVSWGRVGAREGLGDDGDSTDSKGNRDTS